MKKICGHDPPIFEAPDIHRFTAASGQEALAVMAKKIPAAFIILAVMMPDMDGFELLQEIRAVAKVPVLMLTAKGKAEDRFAGFELGRTIIWSMPFSAKELLLRFRRF